MNATELRDAIKYDPISGVFTWLRSQGTAMAGAVAGSVNHHGYREISFLGVKHQANRLAWFMSKGVWPDGVVDHKNRNRDDNRIENLRDTTVALNNLSKGVRSDSKSGIPGVGWSSSRGKWRATGQINGKQKHLGYFACADDAARARHEFCKAEFGDFNAFSDTEESA